MNDYLDSAAQHLRDAGGYVTSALSEAETERDPKACLEQMGDALVCLGRAMASLAFAFAEQAAAQKASGQ